MMTIATEQNLLVRTMEPVLASLEACRPARTVAFDRVIRAGHRLLGLIAFDTARATTPEAAGRVHTDFQRGFIRAESVAFEDYVARGGERGAKDAGRTRVEGGDVMLFRFNH